MKKFILSLLVFCSLLIASPCLAITASADEVSINLLKRWLSEKYGCKIDGDGDLIITHSTGKIIISVIQKAKVIRLYSQFTVYNKRSRSEMIDLANKFNRKKRFLRISVNSDTSSVCDYYIVYNGGLDSKNLYKAIQWFISVEADWPKFVIHGGDEE